MVEARLRVIYGDTDQMGVVLRASLSFGDEIVREDDPGRVLCAGRPPHVALGREGKPVRIPEHLLRLLNGRERSTLTERE